jgi:hypothetical protein
VDDWRPQNHLDTWYSLAPREFVPDEFVVQNNLIVLRPESQGGLFPASISALENPKPGWSFSPNGYTSAPTAFGCVKLTDRDVVDGDPFVESDSELLRPGSRMGRYGEGEKFPCHMGAATPAAAPNWLKTIRKWRDAVLAGSG